MKAPLAITPGEPAGIGPDLIIQIAQLPLLENFVVIADVSLLKDRAIRLELPLNIQLFDPTQPLKTHVPGTLIVHPVDLIVPSIGGKPNPANASYVLQTLKFATRGCLTRQFSALVTGPVHKGVINEAGIAFTGHTEFLAKITGTQHSVMMLVAQDLRVALVTTHLPLSAVAAAITPERLATTVRILARDLEQRFGIKSPRILVCGLNPHAGDGGHLGTEEMTIISPTLQKLCEEGIAVRGPFAADTLFTPKYLTQADAVLAMYHDQGLPVLKYQGFGHAVNVTLGLPIIRTSVDHGTAFDLVHTGQATCGSLLAAIRTAQQLAVNKTLI